MSVSSASLSNPFVTPSLPKLDESLQTLLKQIKNPSTPNCLDNATLTNELKKISPDQINAVIMSFIQEIVEEGNDKDPAELLDRIAELMPYDKLQDCVQEDVGNILDDAKDMIEAAKYYLETTKSSSSSWSARIGEIFDGIIALLEGIISAFGISDFFKPSESEIHSQIKSQRIMMLISLFQMIIGLKTLFEAATVGIYVGAAFLLIGALSLVWNYIKPMPHFLPGDAENWTKQVQKKGCNAQGRKDTLDQIANIMKMNRHAILVGPSRVGKSLTALAFTQAIERGDYPELKGKKVFRINTAEIIGGEDGPTVFTGGSILKRISEAMGHHRDDIILVLDEIHNACKKNSRMADQLKTFLDEAGDFPHVIGITTDAEYDTFVKSNTAFSLRFEKVEIQNTSPDETLKILSDTVLKSSVKPILKDDALLYLFEKSMKDKENSEAPQPSASIKLLKKCINKTGRAQQSATEKKITEITNKISSLRAQAVANRGRKKGINSEISDLETSLKDLKADFELEKKNVEKLFKTKEYFDKVSLASYHTVMKISDLSQKTLKPQDEKQVKLFVLMKEFLGRALEDTIKMKQDNLGIKLIIDKTLIDESF